MADNRTTRQKLYDRIKASSKDEVIISEMRRLGFLGKDENAPTLPELLISRERELNKELSDLLAKKQRFQNKELLLKELRIKRMAEARLRREENKKKRELARFEKAEAWRKRKDNEILHLGVGVSAGLNHTEAKPELLLKHGLPAFADERALAAAMDITIGELRFLAFSRRVSTVNHYRKFYLPKKSGGKRLISAPMPRLKQLQAWILEHLLNLPAIHDAAQGFATDRSIVTNAQRHTGKRLLINIDIKDFFPSVHYKRVKGLFCRFGYSEKIATILALLCTEAVTEEIGLDGKRYFVQKGARVLPQGAPTSPAITNLLCYKMDKRLAGLAEKNGCTYSRYADDISFSTNTDGVSAQQLIWRMKRILQDEGFVVHPGKINVMRKGSRQEVTGVVVNEKMGIPRDKLRKFRALLHQIEKSGPVGKSWGPGHLAASVTGYVNFIRMVDPVKAGKFQEKIDHLIKTQKLGFPPTGI